MTEPRRHVVIIGAGFGGLAAAKALSSLPVDVTVVDARNHHTFQPLLYQVATAGLDAEDVCYPTRGVFHRQRNARVRMGQVTAIDTADRRVTLSDGGELHFDLLVVAAGAVTADFGVPGVVEHAHGLKSASDALAVRSSVLAWFEAADSDPDLVDAGALTTVIVGGGPTGVELAGGMAELIDRVLCRDHPSLDVDRARIVLVEAADRVLGSFSPRSSARARRALEKRGVELCLGRSVQTITKQRVVLDDGTIIAAGTVVWAAGVKANPLGAAIGTALDRTGRVVVGRDLAIPGHPEIFVIGDLAASPTGDGRPLPQVAPVAIQGGRHVAAAIAAQLDGRPPEAFVYRDRGSMATIGRNAAVVELHNGRTLSGWAGWVAWLGLHLVMLIGFRNRANVLVNWAWNYWTYDRGSRLILNGPAPSDRA
ncbi:MAG: NAD(P)/FAD-dependent oxidoreductase [Acidimicrobiia bacterium]|nr:NAD(P)/FAD-dependent oxidoreductase [Acidimicrobiia bacterium]